MQIDQQILLGKPIIQEIPGRSILKYSDNETASYIPNFFLADGKQKLPATQCPAPVETLLRKVHLPHNLSSVVSVLKEDIKNAMETRIQIFLQQILVAIYTGYSFNKYKTALQAGVKIKEKVDAGYLRTAEAHAATLPSLMGMENGIYFRQFISGAKDEKPIAIAKGTSVDKGWNLTHLLPAFVNHIDSRVDEKTKLPELLMKTFRRFCIEILNHCAKGEISLQQALDIYLNKYRYVLNEIPRLKVLAPHKQSVINLYQEVISAYLEQTKNRRFWRTLLFSSTDVMVHNALTVQINRELEVNDLCEKLAERCVSVVRSKTPVVNVKKIKDLVQTVLFLRFDNDARTQVLKLAQPVEESLTVLRYAYLSFLDPEMYREAQGIIENTDLKKVIKWTDQKWRSTPLGQSLLRITDNRQPNRFREICLRLLYLVSFQLSHAPGLSLFFQTNRYEILSKLDPETNFTHHVTMCLADEKVQGLSALVFNEIN